MNNNLRLLQIVTGEYGAANGTKIFLDGVEQNDIVEAHLHIVAADIVRLELKRFVRASISGGAEVVEKFVCPGCDKEFDRQVTEKDFKPAIADVTTLDDKFVARVTTPRKRTAIKKRRKADV